MLVLARDAKLQRMDGVPIERARNALDDHIAAMRAEMDNPERFDELYALFTENPRAAVAYARWGDGIFDAGGGLRDELLDAVCVANSFGSDTLVALGDGQLLPIADVQVGDEVLAYDFDTGAMVAREVMATLPHTDWLLDAYFSDGTVMEVTEDHRFWSITDDAWVELQDLDSNDQLLTPDGSMVTVDWLDWDAGTAAPAWDLTVDDVHNFFVTAEHDGEPILVHNAQPGWFCGIPVGSELVKRLQPVQDLLEASGDIEHVNSTLRLLTRQDRSKLISIIDEGLPGFDTTVGKAELARRLTEFPSAPKRVLKNGWELDYASRDLLWRDDPLTFTGEVTRTVYFREPGPPGDWGVTDVHLDKHFFGLADPSLAANAAGDLPRWLDATEDLLSRAPIKTDTRDGLTFETIRGDFPRAGDGIFRMEVVVHARADGSYDFVTWRTSFNQNRR